MYLLFFFNDTATTEIYTLSLHDALPISVQEGTAITRGGASDDRLSGPAESDARKDRAFAGAPVDRKSTRLNSSHSQISYAVFCLKKKNSNSIVTRHSAAISHRFASTTRL